LLPQNGKNQFKEHATKEFQPSSCSRTKTNKQKLQRVADTKKILGE